MTWIPDQEVLGKAINKGFKVTLSPETGVSMERRLRRIWSLGNGRYQTCNMTRGYATHHKSFDDLSDAIDRSMDDHNDNEVSYTHEKINDSMQGG